jgi:hypothetical protein
MKIKSAIVLIVILSWVSGCHHGKKPEPVHRYEHYSFNSKSPVTSRTSLPPDMVLRHLQNLDNRPDYAGYMPTRQELRGLEQAISMLPPLNRSMVNKRLLGIYFIPNFMGSGLTEWVIDERGVVYGFMVLNPLLLRLDASELLTLKERTCFITDDPAYSIRINAGSSCSSLLYILLHESTHLADYVLHITPYVDGEMNEYLERHITRTPYTDTIWKAYNKPVATLSFSGRVSFYGIKKPGLKLSESLRIYQDLAHSPFASLYGSQTWAEDLAEMESFYHITEILKQPYVITVWKGRQLLLSVRPMDSPAVRRRLPAMDFFYRHEAP